MCPSGVCNEAFMPFRMPPKRRSVGAMCDEERAEEKEEAREEEEEEEEKKYEEEEEEEEEEKKNEEEEKNEEEKDDALKKRKPATKIANQRRKIRRFPVTCCFVNAEGYSCHKGKSNVRATRCVPESERNKFPEDAKCCDACYKRFKYSNVTCCFVNADGYSCHKGKADVQARFRVPESEKNKFSENDRCCKSCYNRLQDAHFFRLKRVCVNCRLLGYDPANTPGAWKLWQVGNDRFLLCSTCYDNSQAQLKRRQNGVPERRKGREAKGDW